MKIKIYIVIFVLLICLVNTAQAKEDSYTIEDCIQEALLQNLDFIYTKKSLEISNLNVKQNEYLFYPTISGSATDRSASDVQAPLEERDSYSLSMNQKLIDFGETRNKISASKSRRMSVVYTYVDAGNSLETSVFKSYMDVWRYKKLKDTKEHAINQLKDQIVKLKESQKKKDDKEDKEKEKDAILRFDVLADEYDQEFIDTRYKLSNAYINLKTLMNHNLQDEIQLVPYGTEEFEADNVILGNSGELDKEKEKKLLDEMFNYSMIFSPSLKVKTQDSKAAEYDLKAQKTGNYPKLDFVPNYDGGSKSVPSWSIGFRLRYNLLNLGDWEEVSIKERRLEQAKLKVQMAYRDARSSIKSRYLRIMSLREQVFINDKKTEKASVYLSAMKKKYNNGKASEVDMVDAYRSYYSAWASRINSLYDYYQARQDLYYTIGYSYYNEIPTIIEYMVSKDKSKFKLDPDIEEGGPVFYAAYKGDLKTVQKLVARNGKLVNHSNNKGWTPLHYAADNGNKKMVEYLLHKGAKVNARTNKGRTPAYIASSQNKPEVLELLIAKGADIDIPAGRTERTPLMRAAKKGFKPIVEILLNSGANVNIKSNSGWTALHNAAEEGYLEIVKLLVKRGGKSGIKNNIGDSPQDVAKENGHEEIVNYLESLKKQH